MWRATMMAVAGGAALAVPQGLSPYAHWPNGPGRSDRYFPIAVWLQNPANAARYQALGINLYVGLWQGPTEQQLAALKAAKMPVICEQNAVGLAHKDDPIIVGWMHGDEPDNAQPVTDPATGRQTWGSCIPPERIVEDYKRLRERDPSRPILLNLGQGVANDDWVGRGPGAKLSDYETYVKGCDIVSFDVYPVAGLDRPDGAELLWYVPKGIDRLVKWTGGKKPVWNCIECTRISSDRKATPEQVRAQVWMALIRGSRGLIYFVHEWKPRFNEHALLDDAPMAAAVAAINRQVVELAPVLYSPSRDTDLSVASEPAEVPVAATLRQHGGWNYLFAVGMRNHPVTARFTIRGLGSADIEAIGEGRTVRAEAGGFRDTFTPYQVHLYRWR